MKISKFTIKAKYLDNNCIIYDENAITIILEINFNSTFNKSKNDMILATVGPSKNDNSE